MYALILLLVVAVFPAGVHAQGAPTGNDLLPECVALLDVNERAQKGEQTPALENIKAMSCLAYLGGIVDANSLHAVLAGAPLFCPPPEADLMQAATVVTRYLQDYPEKRGQGRTLLVHAALIEAFPCTVEGDEDVPGVN